MYKLQPPSTVGQLHSLSPRRGETCFDNRGLLEFEGRWVPRSSLCPPATTRISRRVPSSFSGTVGLSNNDNVTTRAEIVKARSVDDLQWDARGKVVW